MTCLSAYIVLMYFWRYHALDNFQFEFDQLSTKLTMVYLSCCNCCI